MHINDMRQGSTVPWPAFRHEVRFRMTDVVHDSHRRTRAELLSLVLSTYTLVQHASVDGATLQFSHAST